MIVRFRITKTGGNMLRNLALHRCGENVTIEKLDKTIIEGTSGNVFFPAIGPLHLNSRPVRAKCGMSQVQKKNLA